MEQQKTKIRSESSIKNDAFNDGVFPVSSHFTLSLPLKSLATVAKQLFRSLSITHFSSWAVERLALTRTSSKQHKPRSYRICIPRHGSSNSPPAAQRSQITDGFKGFVWCNISAQPFGEKSLPKSLKKCHALLIVTHMISQTNLAPSQMGAFTLCDKCGDEGLWLIPHLLELWIAYTLTGVFFVPC